MCIFRSWFPKSKSLIYWRPWIDWKRYPSPSSDWRIRSQRNWWGYRRTRILSSDSYTWFVILWRWGWARPPKWRCKSWLILRFQKTQCESQIDDGWRARRWIAWQPRAIFTHPWRRKLQFRTIKSFNN